MSEIGPLGPDETAGAPIPPQSDPQREPFEPDLPRFIPVARPVSPGTVIPYARAAFQVPTRWPLPPLRPGRAVFEILMLVPAGLFGSIVGYIAALVLGIRDAKWLLMASTVGMGVCCVVAAGAFVRIDGLALRTIGWTARNLEQEVLIGATALLASYAAFMIVTVSAALLFPSIRERQSRAQEAVRERIPDMNLSKMAIMILFVAVWEEVIFRGFMITRLESLLRKRWLVVPVSAAIFGSAHFYQGPVAVVMISVLGMVMAVLFMWRRSLVPCIVMHFINDMFMLLLMKWHGFSN